MVSYFRRSAAVLAAVLLSGLPAAAQDVALLIGVRDYARLPRVPGAEDRPATYGMPDSR